MHPTLTPLLDILTTIDEDALIHIYNMSRTDDAPLDVALFAWRDAGAPRPGVPTHVGTGGCYDCANFRAAGGVAGSWACAALGDVDGIGDWIDRHNRTANGRRPDGSAPLTVPAATDCPGREPKPAPVSVPA